MSISVLDPDQDAIDRVLQGEKEAFEKLVNRYSRQVYALAFRMVHSREEAADLTQEIFIRAWQKLDTFRGDSKFSTWLFQIAGNHCKNKLKYMKRRFYSQHDSLETSQRDEDNAPARRLSDPGRGPEEEIGGSEVRTLVREKLAELPDEQRIVLVMRDIEDLDYDEIAAATGLALGTVKSRIHRGRIELARKLKSAMALGGT